MRIDFKSLLPHLIALVLFFAIAAIYFHPALEGYALKAHDVKTAKGGSKELTDFRNETGEEALWTNSMFGGMPGTMISVNYNNWAKYVHRLLVVGNYNPVGYLFIYMIGFYILLLSFKVDYRLAILGAIAFCFSSYFFIILQAGHITKAIAIAYMPPTMAGVVLAYRGKRLLGGALFSIFMALEILATHLQITYYMVMLILAFVLSEFVRQFMKKELPEFFKTSAVLAGFLLLSIATSLGSLWGAYEYGPYSTRGKSELTLKGDNHTTGLDKDYVTAWSYGTGETFSLMLPYVKGGASAPLSMLHPDKVSEESLEALSDDLNPAVKQQVFNQIPNESSYWGDQGFTSGNVYAGIVIVYLFLLAMYYLEDKTKWFLFGIMVLTIMLSWGRNMMWLTDIFLDYVPGYNKFRSPSMILVVAELVLPLLGILFLNYLIKNREKVLNNIKGFYYITGAFVLLLIVMALMPDTFFSFFPEGQGKLTVDYLNQVQPGMDPQQQMQIMSFYNNEYYPFLKEVRISIFRSDIFRGLIFLLLSVGVIYMYLKEKLNTILLTASLGILVIVDMWSINKGYVNNEDYDNGGRFWVEQIENDIPYRAFSGDYMILQQELANNPKALAEMDSLLRAANEQSEDGLDPRQADAIKFKVLNKYTDFRVFSVNNPFNESRTSFFFKSIGGYHGAKMKRYQELIDSAISKNNQKVLDMLNTKYIVQYEYDKNTREQNNTLAQARPTALGNAWFVDNVKIVENANEEIASLKEENGFNPARTAVVDKRFSSIVKESIPNRDTTATIKLISYAPNHLVYEYDSKTEQIVVFSEIYYDLGWKAFIDGKPAEQFRADYVLRGLVVPAGKHTIEFKYQLKSFEIASLVSPIVFVLLLIIFIYAIVRELKNSVVSTNENKE